MYCAMKDMKHMGVKLGQDFRDLGWVWPVLATRGSTWAVPLVAVANHVAPFALLVSLFCIHIRTVESFP